MAVLIEGYSVVVRNSDVAAKYPGGSEAYRDACPNATFCADDHLSRVGFMARQDAEDFVDQLAAKGLTSCRDGASADVALVSQSGTPLWPCGWLEIARSGGLLLAWLAGTDRGDLHAPATWNAGQDLQFFSPEEAERRLEFLRSEGGVDVYRDRATGRELYVGRTSPPKPEQSRHDSLYRQACALVEGLILLHGQAPGELDAGSRRRLEEALPLFGEVLHINPGNWAAMWLLGKVRQRLGDKERALEWFARAHRVRPDQPDVAREAAIAAMEVGRPQEAVSFCERAVQAKPDDPGLRANLALALLFSGRPAEARPVAGEALRRDPADQITAHIVRLIDEVLAGVRPCPHHARDVQ